jgi:glycosyltransferase involved in cell wall biosynthesis
VFPILAGNGGGIYQYSLNVLRALAEDAVWPGPVTVLTDHPDTPAGEDARARGWETRTLTEFLAPPARRRSLARRVADRSMRRVGGLPLVARPRRPSFPPTGDAAARRARLATWLRERDATLAYYPSPSALSFELGTPYVFTVHDVQHRLQPRFPEVSAGDEFEGREYVFRNGIREARAVVVDSEVGREDVLEFYGDVIEPERIHVLPFALPPYLGTGPDDALVRRLREQHGLPAEYLFYPAQLWPHKNHLGLVRALGILRREHGLRPPLVLTGSKRDTLRQQTYEQMLESAAAEQVLDQIHYLGFVEDDEMAALYAGAAALVMPTFFGPTNIPVLEAWHAGCPVVTSDIRGIREQVGEAGVLVDPESPAAIAAGIAQALTNSTLREQIVARGKERLAMHSFSRFAATVAEIVAVAGRDREARRPPEAVHR